MRRVRGKLCRTKSGRFTKCRGKGRASTRGGKRCRYGVNKNTGRCLKHPRR